MGIGLSGNRGGYHSSWILRVSNDLKFPMRAFLLLLFLLSGTSVLPQCGPYVAHPVWPDTLGLAHMNINECGAQYTMNIWDNGTTTIWAQGLGVGPHWVVLSDGGALADTVYFDVEQLAWDLNQSVHMMAGQVEVSMWAEVPYCGTSIFNVHACPIDASSTKVYLLQDGIAIDSIGDVQCTGTLGLWSFLPFGYTYQVYLQDQSACGSYAYGMQVQTWSCASGVLDMEVIAATSGNNGSIIVEDVLIDPQAPFAPPLPLTGTLSLLSGSTGQLIGIEPGTSVVWEELMPDTYTVIFTPDILCDPIIQEVTIETSTSMGNDPMNHSSQLLLWPVPVKDILYWSGPPQAVVEVTDLQGRVVLRTEQANEVDVSRLMPGTYQLRFPNGTVRRFAHQ